ncbi:hypothetical protein CCMSSC00406_0003099 [Pleurotus cornucopiae]|uniref:Uncharacterized protein n=1 Tax=Pleurotus cornucopiae TaxID=5321 RepID=A0ACB7J687_PLECO|nr:hypothetical protein CCMSSC00406_0003099 [Pleurotus cornucopiae]
MATASLAIGFAGVGFLWHTNTVHADSIRYPSKSPAAGADASKFEYLRQAAASHFVYDDPGIQRFDSIVVPSNFPAEDFISSAFVHLDTHTWSLFSIFDGHNGPLTSSWLSDNLIPAIVGGLADLFSKQPPLFDGAEHTSLDSETTLRLAPPPHKDIDRALKDAFLRVDNDIVDWAVERAFASPSKADAVNLLLPAQSGSCAIVSFFDSESKKLRVAVTGDSRAVLGRRVDGNIYEVHVLSLDQNAYNPAEDERMSKEHPGETIMANGRVLGWGMSRAFGDATYKWSLEIQKRLHEEYLGDRIPSKVKTPPYFTAEPEITTTDVRPGDFLVMGSDGLWDCLTNEEVVGLVGLWRDTHDMMPKETISSPSEGTSSHHHMITSDFTVDAPYDKDKGVDRDSLPVVLQEDKTLMYPWWRATKKFVNIDANVAAHLARNALGGADPDLTLGLLTMTPPRSRRYRDDLSAIVVFFKDDLDHSRPEE